MVDFVSGYALTNKYEDFAETFAFYVLHNTEFASKAKTNTALQQKYGFIYDNIFPNGEFQNTSFSSGSVADYNWDVTKIPIKLDDFLKYIGQTE